MKYLLLTPLLAVSVWAQTQSPIYSPGDELNKALPSLFKLSGEYRLRFEGYDGLNFKPNSSDNYFLERFRLGVAIQPSPWIKLVAELQDSRAFEKTTVPAAPPYQNIWDLRQAYIEIGDTEKSKVALRVGRQELNFGEERLIGSVNWLNNARTFDAARATIRFHDYRLDAFSSSVVNAYDNGFDHHQPGNNLHGLYGHSEKVIPKAVLEHYVLWRVGPGQKTEAGAPAKIDEKILGVRIAGTLSHNLDYGSEMVLERGGIGSDNISAWAGHWVVGHTWQSVKLKPRLFTEYNYASGDASPKDGQRGTFDNLYPTNHDKYGLSDQVGWKNIKHYRAGLDLKPSKQWSITAKFEDWWLASAADALYSATGAAVVRVSAGTAGTHVGEEFDLSGSYSPSKPFQFGAGFAHILPGEFLKHSTLGQKYSSPYVFAMYKF